MSRFLISCGGTGGHLAPGIALAEGLQARGHAATLLISQKKIDARLIEKYPQLRFARMPGSGFSWHPVQLARCISSQARAYFFCRSLIRREAPDAIVGFGGFTSAPVVLAGRRAGRPVVLHEANRVPGRAIRILGRFATRVYLPPGIQLSGLPLHVVRHASLPVRKEIVRHPVAEIRQALGFNPTQRLLVILGGSQGASALNGWVRKHLLEFAARSVQVCCVTGPGKGDAETLALSSQTGEAVRAQFLPFSDRVAELLSAADLVISRAGAGTIAELIRCRTPAILIPFPHAADDHQRANAAYLEAQGGGVVVEQTRLAELRDVTFATLFDAPKLESYRAQLQRMDQEDPIEQMVNDLEKLAATSASRLAALGATQSAKTLGNFREEQK